jgi:hypothetical protein
MQHNEGAKPSAVPQRIYDWYNAHYSNVSYRAFRDALTESAGYGDLSDTETNEEFITATMNLLIDASFERSGAEHYQGAEARLMDKIAALDSRLTTLARIHLLKFGDSEQEAVEQALKEARAEVEAAARQAGDLHSWRGRVAFAWAYAAAYLLHAAQAILNDKNANSYPLEKLDRAMFHLQNGIIEAEQNGVAFETWFLELVKPRR